MSNVVKHAIYFKLPSRTKQCFKDECDINKIMQRFKKIMGADYLSRYQSLVGGDFKDVSELADYRSAIDTVNAAKDVFGALPAIVRRRFGNDPAEFLDFCQNPDNLPEMRTLGLANPEVVSPAEKQA